MSVTALWTRIRAALDAKSPKTAATLATPATPEEIDALQEAIGLVLPTDLRESLLIHNGQVDPARTSSIAPYGSMMSAPQIAQAWEMLCDIDARLRASEADWDSPSRPEWWNSKWIPFFDLDGDHYCVNLNPLDRYALGGETVVRFVRNNPHESNVAPTYGKWLERVATLLESSRTTTDEYGYLQFDHEPELGDGGVWVQ